MKNIIKILSIFMLVISMTACSVFTSTTNNGSDSSNTGNNDNNNNNSSNNTPKTQLITVYNGNSSTNYTVTFGKTATIDVFTKPGYYFTGAYDTDGTKYFDGNGNSTMVWGVGNPDTFYAKFESVSKCSYLEIDLDEEPQSFLFSKVSRYFTLSDELISAIKANLDYNLNVSISFDAACDTTVNQYLSYAYISNLSSGGTNHYCFEEKTLVPKNGVYKNFSYNFTIKAREFKNGKVYFFINHSYDLYDPDVFYVKNIKLKISFANQ